MAMMLRVRMPLSTWRVAVVSSSPLQFPQGRRRPFILAGTVLASVALIVLAFTQTLYWFSLMFLLLSVANNMILAPCAALLPDLVPADQRGG